MFGNRKLKAIADTFSKIGTHPIYYLTDEKKGCVPIFSDPSNAISLFL